MYVQLGPYELHEVLGQGGLGQVWRARHVHHDGNVAIKLLLPKLLKREAPREAFGNELRAMMRMHHRNIVSVLDAGVIDEHQSEQNQTFLQPHTPYLVMELATHGSLAAFKGDLPWEELLALLFLTLDTLAHAHARGVIHRDIKPENFLLGWREEGHVVRLTDFGLSAITGEHDVALGWGTPYYMAPEQVGDRWREQGPWTDLFSLGCMAHELATGLFAFKLTDSNAEGLAQVDGVREATRLPTSYPDSFLPWLERLLHRAPRERFETAADATWALADAAKLEAPMTLRECNHVLERLLASAEERVGDGGDPLNHATHVTRTTLTHHSGVVAEPTSVLGHAPPPVAPMPSRVAPWREGWRRDETPREAPRMLAPAVAPLRRGPLVGRQTERDLLWHALREARQDKQMHVVVLHGEHGTGKTHLSRWFLERTHELGVADSFEVSYSSPAGPFDGLLPTLATKLGVQGLTGDKLMTALRDLPETSRPRDPEELRQLANLLDTTEGLPKTRELSHLNRYELLRRQLMRLSHTRPLIIAIEDIHLGAEALFFIRYLLRRSSHDLPVVFVLMWRDEHLDHRPLESALLEEISLALRVVRCDLTPMPTGDITELLHVLFPLDDDLANSISERSRGVPLFAMRLIDELIASDALDTRSASGWQVREEDHALLPEDFNALWAGRLKRFFEEHPHARPSLEIGAALGQEVAREEWEHVCMRFGALSDIQILRSAELAGLITRLEPDRFMLADAHLRQLLHARSRGHRRWEAINMCCAHVMGPIDHERRAHHLIEAGAGRTALEDLNIAAQRRLERGELLRTHTLLDSLDEVLDDLNDHDGQPLHRARAWSHRARCFDLQGRYLDAKDFAERARDEALSIGAYALAGRADITRAFAMLHQGATEAAREQFLRISEDEERVAARDRLRARQGLARVAQRRGDLGIAEELFERCRVEAVEIEDIFVEAVSLNGLGDIARQADDLDKALAYSQRALELFERQGHRVMVADCLNDLAELERMRGDYERAMELCQRSMAIFESVESHLSQRVRLELAYVSLGQHQFERARVLLERLCIYFYQAGDLGQLAMAVVGMLPVMAQSGDVERLNLALEHARKLLAKTERRDRDVEYALELAHHLPLPAEVRAAFDDLLANHASSPSVVEEEDDEGTLEGDVVESVVEDLIRDNATPLDEGSGAVADS